MVSINCIHIKLLYIAEYNTFLYKYLARYSVYNIMLIKTVLC